MRGIDLKAGSQLESARSRLIRSPMWKTTTSPSAAAVLRPGTTFSDMSLL
ncbi:hypothetical protein [Streptomyces acidiscabies]|uniref:Uncharacterized protein n=1 Tax=Streptomyces acidiscabies TaxID=42234 RepID=A0AAP6B8Q7_9ACTN|nr:hypothetical protein [Streptomyces acidiscabies]MDX2960115.1 hypothetical protein [Streptomyces acidiscabies]MDX3019466.1 hypothetical protein [Streptomyces acidiscabies]MDX3793135.1 hypothetical protein [Streptomyces acidiscabies]